MPAKAKVKQSTPKQAPRREVERVMFKWTAPARPFKQRDREFWVTIIAISAITGLILFLIEGVMPVILIISLIFLFYILTTVEPDNIEYKITNEGIKIADKTTNWILLRRFWYSKRFDSELLVFETDEIPGRLELVVNTKDKGHIKKVLTKYIIQEEAPASYLDRTANWFTSKLPGN